MRIEYLADNMDYAGEVATWRYKEFIEGIRSGVTYEQVLSSVKNSKKAEFPICLVAVEDGRCVGTISIVHNDLKFRDYTPWLASLYVDPPYRKRKIGELLVGRIMDIARDMGYGELYLRTEHASGYYRKLNWEFVESCEDEFGLVPDVFKKSLAEK
jgi:GNAT superfamily N-acetyltransferase